MSYVQRKVESCQDVDRLIVYFFSIEKLKAWGSLLEVPKSSYYAGMEDDRKAQSFHDWTSGKCKVMLATTAFGLGIDNPHVTEVIIIGKLYGRKG